MTALDMITFLLIGVAAIFGFMRGFVSETLSLIAWVAALAAVKVFATPAADILTPAIGTHAGATVLAFALVFGVTFIGGRMLAKNIGTSSRKSLIGPVDRVLGAGFGALKGLFGAVVLFLVASLVVDTWNGGDEPRPDWMIESRVYPLLNASASALVDMVKSRQKHHKGHESGAVAA